MKKIYMLLVASVMVLSGCASSPDPTEIATEQLEREAAFADRAQEKAQEKLESVPAWFLQPPRNDSSGVYGVGSGESRKLGLAMKKSGMNAQYELAKSFSQVLSGNEQSYQKEGSAQLTEQYTRLVDSLVASVPVNGYETVRQKVVTVDGKFTAYKLLRLSYERFAQSLEEMNSEGVQGEIRTAFSELQKRLTHEEKSNEK
ncbi:hypothetical protein P7F88_03865 [Vibrio hannami]|uniref:hypothetical protein n=1 Tax=Vibrio hannami TaxID=2717094 RepID=UPI00241000DC|nr:hypothetical protein [Vibrio hannami]MDG3085284.1 hypothetical protein [Vibrio hannami]